MHQQNMARSGEIGSVIILEKLKVDAIKDIKIIVVENHRKNDMTEPRLCCKRVLKSSSTETPLKKLRRNECLTDVDDAAVNHRMNSIISLPESTQCVKNKMQNRQNDLHSTIFTANILSPNECIKMISNSLFGFIPMFQSSFTMPPSFFLPITQDKISSYTKDVVSSVCDSDISALRSISEQPGLTLECCNRFGESILHMACRRGLLEVVTFMIDEAKLSIRMRDDCGRTPLHDACWNREPVWEIMDILVRKDPTLLFLADKRGFTPFQYARKEHWHLWREFLYNRRECFQMHKDSLKKYLC